MASPEVLDERVASDDDANGPVLFQAPHWSEPGLQTSVVGFDSIVGYWVVSWSAAGISSAIARASAGAPSVVISAGVL